MPVCRVAGRPVVVCCRNLLQTPFEVIKPCIIHTGGDEHTADVLTCDNVALADENTANTFPVGIIRNGSVYPQRYTFTNECAATLRDVLAGKLVRTYPPPNCS